jgi:hypothetical protein
MLSSKKTSMIGIVSTCVLMALTGQPLVAQAEPQLTMQQEEAAHPRIVRAIHESREALKELHEAPHDFGGNKAAAMRDLEATIRSLKRALYYRLKMDDAAIDRANP